MTAVLHDNSDLTSQDVDDYIKGPRGRRLLQRLLAAEETPQGKEKIQNTMDAMDDGRFKEGILSGQLSNMGIRDYKRTLQNREAKKSE